MSTTSGWTANMHFLLSHQKHFASTHKVRDSLTPPTQMRSNMPPSRNVPKLASFRGTTVACCLKTCPTASPTSPATSNSPTRESRQPKPQWLTKVRSYVCSWMLLTTAVHFWSFYIKKEKKTFVCLPNKMLLLLNLHYFILQSSSSPVQHGVSYYKAAVAYCWPWWHFPCCWKFTGCEWGAKLLHTLTLRFIIIWWQLPAFPRVVCMHKVQRVELNVCTIYAVFGM